MWRSRPARVLRLGLEPVDDRRLLQRLHWEFADVSLQDLDSCRRRAETPNPGRSQVSVEVRVEEACNRLEIGRSLFAGRLDPRIASRLDLTDEQPLPVAHLLHGMHRPLLGTLHPRHGELG